MSSKLDSSARVYRLPALAYLAALFLLFGTIPVAFTESSFRFDGGGEQGPEPLYSWPLLFLLIPILAAVFIRRAATFVDADGIRIRAVFGSRTLRWDQIRGLTVQGRSVYAVLADGAIRLPCVRQGDLGAIGRVSGGRLPDIGDPKPKFAPSRRSRRRAA